MALSTFISILHETTVEKIDLTGIVIEFSNQKFALQQENGTLVAFEKYDEYLIPMNAAFSQLISKVYDYKKRKEFITYYLSLKIVPRQTFQILKSFIFSKTFVIFHSQSLMFQNLT